MCSGADLTSAHTRTRPVKVNTPEAGSVSEGQGQEQAPLVLLPL